MSAMARLRQCVICDKPTDQECLWCDQPLHRHVERPGDTEQVEFTECWTRHQGDCTGADIGGLEPLQG